jgi:hypothetical protein
MVDDEAPAPEDAPSAAQPVEWAPPEPATGPTPEGGPRSQANQVLEALAWIVGLLALLFFGRVYALLAGSEDLSAYEAGRVFGSIFGAVLIGVFVRWLIVKIRKRGRVLSPWILIIASLVLLLNLGRQSGPANPTAAVPTPSPSTSPSATAAPSEPISHYLGILAPFTLTAASADERADFVEIGAGATEVRRVEEAGELIGYLVVTDAGVRNSPANLRRIEVGFEKTDGGEAHAETLDGRDVLVGTVTDVSTLVWIEQPYLLVVYSSDEATARSLARSIISAYE